MPSRRTTLDQVIVAVPCEASWSEMTGNDQVRFCSHCKLKVYNLSAMTREAAQELVQQSEGRLCVRFYRRPDGTMLTDDCQARLGKTRRRVLKGLALGAAILAAWLGLIGIKANNMEPLRTLWEAFFYSSPPPPQESEGSSLSMGWF